MEGRLSYPLVEVKGGSRQQQEAAWGADMSILGDVDSLNLSPTERRQTFTERRTTATANNGPSLPHHVKATQRKESKQDDFQLVD